MDRVVIHSQLKIEEIVNALRTAFPDKNLTVCSSYLEKKNFKSPSNQQIFVSLMKHDDLFYSLGESLEDKKEEVKEAEESAQKAVHAIQSLHKQQIELNELFESLHKKYEEQKAAIQSILWDKCASYHPLLRQIPLISDARTCVETEFQIGDYTIGQLLGDGQFADVKICQNKKTHKEYAVKIIAKDKVTSITSLINISNEIGNLRKLKSPYVVSVDEVIRTNNNLYIITEKGGKDLFDFIDMQPDGVPEIWAKEIISCIMKGVLHCHEHGICHRDLKPENILLTFDEDQEKCVNLKLCDFGLSATFVPNQPLTEFCGSPGFFAAEMLIHGKYFGDKVDVWSIGCILMELILGPNKFHEIWMINYSPDIVMEKDKFSEGISETLNELNEFLYSFSPEVRDLISKLLSFHATNRPVISALVNHPWCSEYLQDAMTELVQVKRQMSGQFSNSNHLLDTPTLVQHAERPWSPSPAPLTISLSFDGSNIRPGSAGNRNNSNSSAQNSPMVMLRQPSNPQQAAPQDIIKSAYDNLSDKERKQIEEYILQQRQQNESPENMIKLPPITPATPSISHARKILRRGEELANRSVSEQQAPNHHNMHSHNNHNQPQDNGQQHPKGILTSSSYDLLQPTYSNSEIPLSPMGGISQNSFHTPLSHKNRSPLPSVSELNFGIDDGIDSMNNTMNESKHK